MFVITGASGNIGKIITEKLLAEGKKVKVFARHKEKLATLEKLGAEMVVGDLGDSVFLAKTFSGAEAVFTMLPMEMNVTNVQAHQDRIGGSIAKAVAESGVTAVVNLSSMGAHLPAGTGPILGLHRLEEGLNAIANLNVLHLRPAYFMENLFSNIGMIKNMGIAGSPIRADMKIAQIATRDIGVHAALRLLKKDFQGKQVQELLGQRDLSMEEVIGILGKAIGKPELNYVQFPYADALAGMTSMGMSPSLAESYIEMSKGFNENILGVVNRNAGNTTPTSIEDFAPIFAEAFNA